MRISLLQQREPFGSILEQTLSAFWTGYDGRPYEVSWQDGRVPGGPDAGDGQVWLANRYLNSIFRPNVEDRLLDQVRQEFSRSRVWWRRPLQAAYVRQATAPGWSARLAQNHMVVTPALPDAQTWLVIPGNHKIRLLNGRSGLAYGVRKAGFNPDFLRNELAARSRAARAGVQIPPLRETDPNGEWFAESLVSGMPANRLAGADEANAAVRATAVALARYVESTCHTADYQAYAQGLQSEAVALLARNSLFEPRAEIAARGTFDALARRLAAQHGGAPMWVAQSHGDFQPANILVDGPRTWLIDWEYADERQVAYDALVFAAASRSPRGLAGRLRTFVQDGWPADLPLLGVGWPGLEELDAANRARCADLFLLEELLLQLRENSQPPLTRLGEGLLLLLDETDKWLAEEEYDG